MPDEPQPRPTEADIKRTAKKTGVKGDEAAFARAMIGLRVIAVLSGRGADTLGNPASRLPKI